MTDDLEFVAAWNEAAAHNRANLGLPPEPDDYPHFRVQPHRGPVDGDETYTVTWHPDGPSSEVLGEGLDRRQAIDLLNLQMVMRPWLDDGSLT